MKYIVPNSLARLECVQFQELGPCEQYGHLVLGPLAPGQGVTIGNTFRRLMLNDLSGVAITAAKINDAQTEFTTLPGIRESVVEIFLNLRQVTFFNTFPEVLAPQGRIAIDLMANGEDGPSNLDSGETMHENVATAMQSNSTAGGTTDVQASKVPRRITAADMELPEQIQCVDPTQHIATLVHPQARFDLVFMLEQGTGYRVWKKPTQPQGRGAYPAQTSAPLTDSGVNLYPTPMDATDGSEGNGEETPDGLFQPIDGNFMPVKSVNFSVQDMPPDGEYIHFEITTNGSVHPQEAFKQAGVLLNEITHAALREPTYTPAPPSPEPQVVSTPRSPQQKEYLQSISIEQLELSLRAYNCLKRAEIVTLADLARQSTQSLLSLRNFGQKSAEEVRKALATYNIELPDE